MSMTREEVIATLEESKRQNKIMIDNIMPIVSPGIELVENLEETERGNGGFGSTGR